MRKGMSIVGNGDEQSSVDLDPPFPSTSACWFWGAFFVVLGAGCLALALLLAHQV